MPLSNREVSRKSIRPSLGSSSMGKRVFSREFKLQVVRQLVSGEAGVAEKKMFGGLAFLVGGNMAVGVSGQGGLLVRVDPEESDELVASTSAELMEMRGRSMRGWLRVAAADLDSDAALAEWVDRGTAYARSLPPK